jgi:hypothetical protein
MNALDAQFQGRHCLRIIPAAHVSHHDDVWALAGECFARQVLGIESLEEADPPTSQSRTHRRMKRDVASSHVMTEFLEEPG